MIFDARKVWNKSTVFYLKAKRYNPEEKEALINLPEDKKYSDYKKEEWRNNLGLLSKMGINFVHMYSHLGERLLRIAYNAIGFKLTRTLQVFNVCA